MLVTILGGRRKLYGHNFAKKNQPITTNDHSKCLSGIPLAHKYYDMQIGSKSRSADVKRSPMFGYDENRAILSSVAFYEQTVSKLGCR